MRARFLPLFFVLGACTGASADNAEKEYGVRAAALTSSGWVTQSLPPLGVVGSPAVVRISDSTIEVLARDANDSTIRRLRKAGYAAAWTGGPSLGSDTFTGSPAAVGFDEDLPGSNRYAAFARKADGTYYVWIGEASTGATVTAWTQLSTEVFESGPAVAIAGGLLWVVGRKSDGKLYAATQALQPGASPMTPGGFGAFTALPALPAGQSFDSSVFSSPAVSGANFWQTGGPAFYGKLADGRLVTNVNYTDGSYSGWQLIGTLAGLSPPVVTSSNRVARTTLYSKDGPKPILATGFLSDWPPFTEMTTGNLGGIGAVDGTYSFGGPSGNIVHHLVVSHAGKLHWRGHVDEDVQPRSACKEVKALIQKAPHVKQVMLPASGELVLSQADALTHRDLDGIPLDESPPVLGTPSPAYSATFADDGTVPAPWATSGIAPFRMSAFRNEFNVAGWHTWNVTDYASVRGFSFVRNYSRNLSQVGHLPSGTEWQIQLGMNWSSWMTSHGLTAQRWDQLADLDLVSMLSSEGYLAVPGGGPPTEKSLLLNIEEAILMPTALRAQPWYPNAGTPQERADFEAKYYRGVVALYVSQVEVARARGYQYISIYGWSPVPRLWGDYSSATVVNDVEQRWQLFGSQVYDAVDGVSNSAYTFYFTPENLAHTLANADLNVAKVAAQTVRKPVVPYYWTLYHGGGGGWRWWAYQPMLDEESRSITAMSFFTGVSGTAQYIWTGTGAFSAPPPIAVGRDLMLGKPLSLTPSSPAGEPATQLDRYEIIHVNAIGPAGVEFQRLNRFVVAPHDITPAFPSYTLDEGTLQTYLRPSAEALRGVFEGMALVKPFEETLRNGTVKIDVSAAQQFAARGPVSRRVKRDGVHLLVASDPYDTYFGTGTRDIVLNDFDGRPGRSVRIPADGETRVWVLVDSVCQ